jgi:hypothetical protein
MFSSVFGFADSISEAEKIVAELRDACFPPESVSLLYPRDAHHDEILIEKGNKAPEGVAAGAGTGGFVGGALGWLTGIGALAIPGAGPFVAAGPIMAALSGVALGATVGGIAGGLFGVGIPEYEATHLEERIRNGEILIAVRVVTDLQQASAVNILRSGGASDVAYAAEGQILDSQPHA